ncbi:antibiotic biosynthesis monooxygenase family protein [Streptomyces chartreusis]|uniref:antibiotic biosynthesis monooxygenase family protein n=1 Tax=Streptomyces chartreusis TaxID=1969 RepID=UPI00367FD2C5
MTVLPFSATTTEMFMEATLINVFIVPKHKEEEFLTNWHATSAVYRDGGGLIEAHLHRNTGVGNDTFSFINIARWVSADAWRIAHADYVPGEYAVEGVMGHPSIFENIADIYSTVLPANQDRDHWLARQDS